MALNDWADRAEDAIERPHRPLPSGRISPSAALGAAAALTAGGLALAAGAGRPALTVASGLAATVWAYDLGLKHTPAGPSAMATARALDLLLGAAATSAGVAAAGAASAGSAFRGLRSGHAPGHAPRLLAAVPAALVLGAHTLAVTAVSRREAQGGSTVVPLGALAATVALAQLLARSGGAAGGLGGSDDSGGIGGIGGTGGISSPGSTGAGAGAGTSQLPAGRGEAATRGLPGFTTGELTSDRLVGRRAGGRTAERGGRYGGLLGSAAASSGSVAWRAGARGAVQAALAVTYAATAARPLFHAALNPSPQLTQRAVGGGIRAMIPLQAALSARAGSLAPALLTAALAPAARKFGRKVSVT